MKGLFNMTDYDLEKMYHPENFMTEEELEAEDE